MRWQRSGPWTLVLVALASVAPASAQYAGVSVLDHGAVADGATDSTAAFQAALDVAGEVGGVVFAPPGRYLFRGSLLIPEAVTLAGSWQHPPAREKGTVLMPTAGQGEEDGTPFITLEGAAGIQGLVITYPEQVTLQPPPIPYPWTVRGLAQDCFVRNVLMVRPYQAIDFGTYPCSRHLIDGFYGSPLRRGIYVDRSIDVGRINNVHFSSFFFPFEGPLDTWKRENAEALIIGRADWEWITNLFALGYAIGFHFQGSADEDDGAGLAHYVAISHSGIDLSQYPMVVEESSAITVSQSVFKGLPIRIEESNTGPVKFSQCWFSPVPGTSSLVEARGRGRVSFVDCSFEYWDTLAQFAPALLAACDSLLVQGCEFGTHNGAPYFIGDQQKPQIEIKESVVSAVVSGNRLRYGEAIINHSGGDVVIESNITDDADAWE